MRLKLIALFLASFAGLTLHADIGVIVPLTISGTVTVDGPGSSTTTTKGNIKTETFTSSCVTSKITNATVLSFLATNYPAIVPNTNYTINLLYGREGLIRGIYLIPKGATPTPENTVRLTGYLTPYGSGTLKNSTITLTKTLNPPATTGVKIAVTHFDCPTYLYRGVASLNCTYNATFSPVPKDLDFNDQLPTKISFSPLVGRRQVGLFINELIQLNLVAGKAQAIPDISVFGDNEIP